MELAEPEINVEKLDSSFVSSSSSSSLSPTSSPARSLSRCCRHLLENIWCSHFDRVAFCSMANYNAHQICPCHTLPMALPIVCVVIVDIVSATAATADICYCRNKILVVLQYYLSHCKEIVHSATNVKHPASKKPSPSVWIRHCNEMEGCNTSKYMEPIPYFQLRREASSQGWYFE